MTCLYTFHSQAETKIYQDQPLIFFHEPQEQKNNMDDPLYEQKMRLFGTTDVLNKTTTAPKHPFIKESSQKTQIKTTSIFGKEYTTVPVNQTTQVKVIIMPFVSSEVLIKEFQHFIQTSPLKLKNFQKIIPKANKNTYIKFATLMINNQKYPLDIHETETEFILKSSKELTQGNYLVVLEYIIENAWKAYDNTSLLRLSILNHQWPFAINHLSILVLPPSQDMIISTTPFFGKNKVLIPDYFNISKDNEGNILYQTNHPIPAYAQLNFSLKANKDVFLLPSTSENTIVYLLYFIVSLYTLFYLFIFNKSKKSISVSMLTNMHPIFVKFYLKRNSKYFYNRLNELTNISSNYLPYLKELNNLSHPLKKRLFIFIHTLMLFKSNLFIFIFLPLAVLLTLYGIHHKVSEILIFSVILIPLAGTTILYYFGGKKYFRRIFNTIPNRIIGLLEANRSLAVSKNLYKRFIIWTTIFPIHQKMDEIIERQAKYQ